MIEEQWERAERSAPLLEALRRAYRGPGGVGCSKADEKEAHIAYLSDEEQRQRVIEVVLREKGEDCPELVVVRARARLGGGLVDYRCKEGDPSDSLMLTPEDARYVGIDMRVPDPPETGGSRVFTLNFVESAFSEVQHSPVPLPGALGTGRGVFSPKCKH